MTKNISITRAAKKAHKAIQENDTRLKAMTHAQFLNEFSTWIGYRNYHEAYLTTNSASISKNVKSSADEELSSEDLFKKAMLKILNHPKMSLLTGSSGTGKSALITSLLYVASSIKSSVKNKKKIRIIDIGASYKSVVERNGGKYFEGLSEQALQAWHEDDPLVVIDVEKQVGSANFNLLLSSEKTAQRDRLIIIEEVWRLDPSQFDEKKLQSSAILFVVQDLSDIKAWKNAFSWINFDLTLNALPQSNKDATNWLLSYKSKDLEFGIPTISSLVVSHQESFYRKAKSP